MPKKILIVDDEPQLVEAIKVRLEAGGYEACGAGTGEEALDKIHAGKPDLILLDIGLPGMSGYQFCAKLKQEWEYKHIPIIILSAKGGWKDKSYAKTLDVDDYIVKPVDGKVLLERIATCLARSPGEKLTLSQIGRRKILIADGDKNLAKQLMAQLQTHSFLKKDDKYSGFRAETGPEVMEMVRRERPDLIALDAKLAELDGYKVCERLKTAPEFQKITVLILSDEKEEDIRMRVDLAGADGYLVKPFTPLAFIEKIKELLGKQGAMPTGH